MITEGAMTVLKEIVKVSGEKKYEMIKVNDKLYKIRALRNFGDVKKGDWGGYIQKEENLSHFGNCWVYNEASVRGNAKVSGNAKVKDNAFVFDSAIVGAAAIVSERAVIRGHAEVLGCARISGGACVRSRASVGDNAIVDSQATINEDAKIEGNAIVTNSAYVGGRAVITGNAVVKDSQRIEGNAVVNVDLSKNLKENIRCQTGLCPIGDYVIAYKEVNDDLTSNYDKNFKYEVGKWVEVDYENQLKIFWEQNREYLGSTPSFEKMAERDKTDPCSVGLHFSNATYWNSVMNNRYDARFKKLSSTMLIARINLDDIITVQAGKIRCKRAYIMDSYKINY